MVVLSNSAAAHVGTEPEHEQPARAVLGPWTLNSRASSLSDCFTASLSVLQDPVKRQEQIFLFLGEASKKWKSVFKSLFGKIAADGGSGSVLICHQTGLSLPPLKILCQSSYTHSKSSIFISLSFIPSMTFFS